MDCEQRMVEEERFEELVNLYLDGEIDEEGSQELRVLLSQSPERRQKLREAVHVHQAMCWCLKASEEPSRMKLFLGQLASPANWSLAALLVLCLSLAADWATQTNVGNVGHTPDGQRPPATPQTTGAVEMASTRPNMPWVMPWSVYSEPIREDFELTFPPGEPLPHWLAGQPSAIDPSETLPPSLREEPGDAVSPWYTLTPRARRALAEELSPAAYYPARDTYRPSRQVILLGYR